MAKMLRKTKKAIAVVLTAGMLMGAVSTPVVAATEGWKKDGTGWWYQNANGSYPKNKWEKINGAWYYFDARGYMLANSWVKDNGKWYYVGSTGAMKANDWVKGKAGEWYYMGADGAMKVNDWAQDKDESWYYFGNDGVMKTDSFIKDKSGKQYYLDSEGVMETDSWVQDKFGKKYYMGNDGSMIIDSDGNTIIGSITCDIDDSWTILSGASDGAIYLIPSANEGAMFIALVSETKAEVSENDLVATKDALLQQYKEYDLKVVADTTVNTPCGTGLSFTLDVSNFMNDKMEGHVAYIKQVLFMNGNELYLFQIICVDDDFATLEPQFDAIISNISK